MTLQEILSGGGLWRTAIRISEGGTSSDILNWVNERFPGLNMIEQLTLIQHAMTALQSAEVIMAQPVDEVIPIEAVPVIPEISTGPGAGGRAYASSTVTLFDDKGNVAGEWYVVIPWAGTETWQELEQMAIDELMRRVCTTPEKFPTIDCDNPGDIRLTVIGAARGW